MAKLSLKKGTTSYLARIFIQDSTSTTGAGKTGLTSGSTGLVCYRARDDDGNAAGTAISLSAGTRGTWSSGGFVEKDSTNMAGVYEFGIPNAALATGSNSVLIMLSGVTGMAPLPLEIELTGWDNQDAVRAGLTALPNAAAEAAGGLYTRGTGAGQIKQTNNGEIDANATHVNNVATTSVTTINANVGTTQPTNFTGTAGSALVKCDTIDVGGTAQTGRDLGASVLLSAGTGTGQLDFTSGVVKANLAQILGTALTETSGQIAAAFKKLFDVAAPVFTATSVNQTGDNYARIGAPAGASVSADVAAIKADSGAVKTQTDKLTFTVANQVDSNVLDWKSSAAPAMTGDAYARLGAPAGASVSADIAALPTATATADALLKRDMSAVSGEAARSPLNALRFLRNLWQISGGTLTVTKEDDTTTAWSGTVTTTAGDPVSKIDPA